MVNPGKGPSDNFKRAFLSELSKAVKEKAPNTETSSESTSNRSSVDSSHGATGGSSSVHAIRTSQDLARNTPKAKGSSVVWYGAAEVLSSTKDRPVSTESYSLPLDALPSGHVEQAPDLDIYDVPWDSSILDALHSGHVEQAPDLDIYDRPWNSSILDAIHSGHVEQAPDLDIYDRPWEPSISREIIMEDKDGEQEEQVIASLQKTSDPSDKAAEKQGWAKRAQPPIPEGASGPTVTIMTSDQAAEKQPVGGSDGVASAQPEKTDAPPAQSGVIYGAVRVDEDGRLRLTEELPVKESDGSASDVEGAVGGSEDPTAALYTKVNKNRTTSNLTRQAASGDRPFRRVSESPNESGYSSLRELGRVRRVIEHDSGYEGVEHGSGYEGVGDDTNQAQMPSEAPPLPPRETSPDSSPTGLARFGGLKLFKRRAKPEKTSVDRVKDEASKQPPMAHIRKKQPKKPDTQAHQAPTSSASKETSAAIAARRARPLPPLPPAESSSRSASPSPLPSRPSTPSDKE